MLTSLFLLLLSVVDLPPATTLHDCLEPGRRIVFIGDSITFSGDYVALFEQSLSEKLFDAPEVLNLGLSSETVSGLSEEGHAGGQFPRPDVHERLARLLQITQPDLVIACYGMNCGVYQPLAPERLAAYQKGIDRLCEAVDRSGASLILVTPPPFDGQVASTKASFQYPGYDSVLQTYSQWLIDRRDPRVMGTIDLHRAFSSALARERQLNPNFTFQADAVHPNVDGHRVIATTIIHGVNEILASQSVAEKLSFSIPPGAVPDPRAVQRMRLLRDAYLTAVGHKRPGIAKGLPLEEAWQKANSLLIKSP